MHKTIPWEKYYGSWLDYSFNLLLANSARTFDKSQETLQRNFIQAFQIIKIAPAKSLRTTVSLDDVPVFHRSNSCYINHFQDNKYSDPWPHYRYFIKREIAVSSFYDLRSQSVFDILHVSIADHLVVTFLTAHSSILLATTNKKLRTILHAIVLS